MEYASKSYLSGAYKNHRYICILNRLKHELPLSILKTIYNTLFLSHLNYVILLWGSETEGIQNYKNECYV